MRIIFQNENEIILYPNQCEECGKKVKDKGFCYNHLKKYIAGQAFIENIKKLGGKIVGEYKGKDIPVDCLCGNNHKCKPRPNDIRKGDGMCKVCVNKDFQNASLNFIINIEKLGGKIIGEYKGRNIPVECLCKLDHKCNPRPSDIQQGQGMCKVCSRTDSKTAKDNFIKNIEKLGGQVIGEYKKCNIQVKCLCIKGHICYPFPNSIQQGHYRLCSVCAQSSGEVLIDTCLRSLQQEMKFDYSLQYKFSVLPKLKFDFHVTYNDYSIFIEFDGEQHFHFVKLFHKTEEKFKQRREIDILKTFVAVRKNAKIIRIDYTWLRRNRNDLLEYLKKHFKSDELLIAESELYKDWINRTPNEETINKYYIDL